MHSILHKFNYSSITFSSQASVVVTCRGNLIAPDGWNNWYSLSHVVVPSCFWYEPPWLDSKILPCCGKMISYRKSSRSLPNLLWTQRLCCYYCRRKPGLKKAWDRYQHQDLHLIFVIACTFIMFLEGPQKCMNSVFLRHCFSINHWILEQ